MPLDALRTNLNKPQDSMRKIIFVNRYYWPDHSATSQILTDLTVDLATDAEEGGLSDAVRLAFQF